MSKRRFREDAETPAESQTPEERRAQRRKDRALGQKGKKPKSGPTSAWRRAALLGIPAVVIVAVVVVLVFGNLFSTPCITLQPIPPSSGVPGFPPHTTSDFSQTWCPSGVSLVMEVFPYIQININGHSVGIPPTQAASSATPDYPSIGRNTSYPGNYACNLPVATHPPLASQGYPDGIIYLASPWPYIYTLSTFFQVWAGSFSSVNVNASYAAQPIVYQTNDLLGFTSDATHKITLFVDGQVSSAGPSLALDTLDYGPNPYPACMSQKYGTGHIIVLSYSLITPAVRGSGLHPATLSTAPGVDPMVYLTSLGGVLEKVGNAAGQETDRAHAMFAGLSWLVLRPLGA
ncbi:MAG: hypothetical protein L3K17_06070 [Thermoplasmata archaeon]|nr:hypothetical protein [Thermoplasmata archaeon]